MFCPRSDENQRGTREHGYNDGVGEKGTACTLGPSLGEPNQNSCDAPPKDGEDVPACPNDADMTFPDDATAIGWDQPTLTHATKDEVFAKHGMHEANQNRQGCCCEEELIHWIRGWRRIGHVVLPNATVELRPKAIERAERAHNSSAGCSNDR